jgi:hypothetical protein
MLGPCGEQRFQHVALSAKSLRIKARMGELTSRMSGSDISATVRISLKKSGP